jgi:hypothetical protein
MNNLDDYYMNSMVEDINSFWEEDPDKARELMILLSIQGNSISETMFKFYSASLDISENVLYQTAAFFKGCDIITIKCDCDELEENFCEIANLNSLRGFAVGEQCKNSKDKIWTDLNTVIIQLKEAIYEQKA